MRCLARADARSPVEAKPETRDGLRPWQYHTRISGFASNPDSA